MEEGTNGSKVPFGPHGEGCECGADHGEPEETEAPEETAEPESEAGVPFEIPQSSHESVFMASAESLSSAFVTALGVCAEDECPLSERQLAHVLAGLLQGHAQAKEYARIIEHNFAVMRMMAERHRAALAESEEAEVEEGQAAEAGETDAGESEEELLNDVTDLFSRRPPHGPEQA